MSWLWWSFLVPLLDLILLTRLGPRLGAGKVLLWLGLAAVLGFLCIRTRGFRLPSKTRNAQGRSPLEPPSLLDHLLVLTAGILLIFPGPVSDLLGLSLLFPAVRRAIRERLRETVLASLEKGGRLGRWRWTGFPHQTGPASAEVKDGFPGAEMARDVEFEEIRSKRGEREAGRPPPARL